MNQNDYIILRDENGKAYIAHAGLLDNAKTAVNNAANAVKGIGRGVRQNHKYILKVFENQKPRYFYTQEEVKAYYEAKKKGIKNAAEYVKNNVREATGHAARDRMDTAAKRGEQTSADVQKTKNWMDSAKNDRDKAASNYRQAILNTTQASNDYNQSNIFNRKKRGNELIKATEKEQEAERQYNSAQKEYNTSKHAYEGSKNKDERAQIDYYDNKRIYDKSLAAKVDKAVPQVKEAASSAFNKAKDAASNTISNAKNAYERMKDEFRDKAEQAGNAVKSTAKNTAEDIAFNAKYYSEQLKEGITGEKASKIAADIREEAKDWKWKANQTKDSYSKEFFERQYQKAEDFAKRFDDQAAKSVKGRTNNASNSVQGMIDKARTAVKDKSEDLSAKAKSTAQSARDSVQGMIENARSSTAKAVNEAWDKIPKNADGTVNIFDKNFQSTYNNWKAKKDKYDSSLTGRAKNAAEKATDSVKDMIDKAKDIAGYDERERARQARNKANAEYERAPTSQEAHEAIGNATGAETAYNKTPLGMIENAKKAIKGNSGSINTRATKSSYGEYSDNDKDFAEENYSDKNHVEDTDFYTFKRSDGQWVILEEDMKWVLPKGVTGNDPGIRNALKQFADSASSAKAIGNDNYNTDQWVDAVTDAIDKAAEKQRKK